MKFYLRVISQEALNEITNNQGYPISPIKQGVTVDADDENSARINANESYKITFSYDIVPSNQVPYNSLIKKYETLWLDPELVSCSPIED